MSIFGASNVTEFMDMRNPFRPVSAIAAAGRSKSTDNNQS